MTSLRSRRKVAAGYAVPRMGGALLSSTSEIEEYGVWKVAAGKVMEIRMHIEVNQFFDPTQKTGGGGTMVVRGPKAPHQVQVFAASATLQHKATKAGRTEEGLYLIESKGVGAGPWEAKMDVIEGGQELCVRCYSEGGDLLETARVYFPHTGRSLWRARSEGALQQGRHIASEMRWKNFLNKETIKASALIEKSMLRYLVTPEGGFAEMLQGVTWIQEAVAYAELKEHHLYHLMATLLWLEDAEESKTSTPTLQDFDRVYSSLFRDEACVAIDVGDVEGTRPDYRSLLAHILAGRPGSTLVPRPATAAQF